MPTDIVAGAFHVVPSATVTLDPDERGRQKEIDNVSSVADTDGMVRQELESSYLPQDPKHLGFHHAANPLIVWIATGDQ